MLPFCPLPTCFSYKFSLSNLVASTVLPRNFFTSSNLNFFLILCACYFVITCSTIFFYLPLVYLFHNVIAASDPSQEANSFFILFISSIEKIFLLLFLQVLTAHQEFKLILLLLSLCNLASFLNLTIISFLASSLVHFYLPFNQKRVWHFKRFYTFEAKSTTTVLKKISDIQQ